VLRTPSRNAIYHRSFDPAVYHSPNQNMKEKIMINLESHGQEINRLHQLAHQLAADAVVNAVAAGDLLLEAKRELKHGQFQQWVKKTVNVSLRQAQRYMAAAEGKRLWS
jgi:hypothetical protein